MAFLVRSARSPCDALLKASAMEEFGAEVVSISYGPDYWRPDGATTHYWQVFARIPEVDFNFEGMDNLIEIRLREVNS